MVPFLQLARSAAVAALLWPTFAAAIWPQPASISRGHATVKIDTASFRITSSSPLPDDLTLAVERTQEAIRSDRLEALVVGRGEDRRAAVSHAPLLPSLRIQLDPRSPSHRKRAHGQPGQRSNGTLTTLKAEITQPVEHYDEEYELSVPANGSAAVLSAASSLGVIRGLATFQQLFFDLPTHGDTADARSGLRASVMAANGSTIRYVPGVPLHIQDRPAFPWRGLLLDTSRNFFSVASIKHMLDAMALVKLNTFHWHIVDAQSFPLQLPGKLGVLAEKGAYSARQVYSVDDVADLVDYAAQRGININVEIDMPGHMYEGIIDYDASIVVCPKKSNWPQWSNEPPSGQLALNDTAATNFATNLIATTAKLFSSPYFSTGGDEVEFSCYNATSASEIDGPLLRPFIETIHAAVEQAGKRPLVWEEMAINFPQTGASLRNGTIVEAWTSSANVAAILRATPSGVKLIHAPSDYFYLDCGAGGWLGAAPDRQSWCPFVTWQKSYTFDPYAGTEGIDGGRERVLGGEAALWSEQADEVSMDGYLWPRAGSAAEVFWTGATYQDSDATKPRSVTEALPRLHELRYRLVNRGYGARPLQPEWCALRPGQCDLV